MKKAALILSMFILCLLAGCTVRTNSISPNEGSTQTDDIGFRYYYHGFLIESTDEGIDTVPDQIYIIETQEEYDNFMSSYELSSIYPLNTVDFEKECLIYCGYRSAQGVRGWSVKIQKICISDNQINLVEDETANYQAEHQEDAIAYQIIGSPDCAVREIYLLIVQKEDLPESLYDQYQFSKDF